MIGLGEKDRINTQAFLDQVRQRANVPGISVAISNGSDTLCAVSGMADPAAQTPLHEDHLFAAGCVNKFLTSLAFATTLVSEGMAWDAPIAAYLPELAGSQADFIHIEHLLSHTAGYQGENLLDADVVTAFSLKDMLSTFHARRQLFPPGTVFDYSHSAIALAARLLERRTGTVQAILARHVLQASAATLVPEEQAPAIRLVTGHLPDGRGGYIAVPAHVECGSFWNGSLTGAMLRMSDLARLGVLLAAGDGQGAALADLICGPRAHLPATTVVPNSEERFYRHGLGVARYPTGPHGTRSTTGGQVIAMRFDRERSLAVAIGINALAPHIRDFVLNKLYNALLPADPRPLADLGPAAGEDFSREEVVGEYEGAEHNLLRVVIEGSRILVRPGHNPAVPVDQSVNVAEFRQDGKGRVVPVPSGGPVEAGFFRAPDGGVCLMAGVNAFRLRSPSL